MSDRKVLTRLSLKAMAPLLVLVSAGLYADEAKSPLAGDGWGEWKALSKGYVARRKEPSFAMQQKAAQSKLARLEGRNDAASAKGSKALAATTSVIQKVAVDNDKSRHNLWLHTREGGLYGVQVDELSGYLDESSKDLRKKALKGQLSLINAGQPVPWHFDEGRDMLLFVGEAYDSFHADENAYEFGQDHKAAIPMEVSQKAGGKVSIGPGEERPFRETLRLEEEPDYLFMTWTVAAEPDADYWAWDYLYGGYKDIMEVDLHVPDPAPVGTARIRIRLRGATDMAQGDDHHVWAELNGVQIGLPKTWDGFEEVVLEAEFDQGLLDPDGANDLRLYNAYLPGEVPVQWLDDVEIAYDRLPVALGGSLWLHDAEVETQTVSGFTGNDILVIESPGGASVVRNDVLVEPDGGGGYAVTFDAGIGFDYLVTEAGALQSPALVPVPQSNLEKLKKNTEYLVIAPREFEGTANALVDHRAERFKQPQVVWMHEIYEEFSHGRVDPTAVAKFMQWAQSEKISPSYVVLVGKGTLDHKDRMGFGDSHLPMMMTSTPWSLAASDDRLLTGEAGAPFVIGRLPIINDEEGLAYVQKLVEFESSVAGPEQYEAVLVADNPDVAGDFHANSEALATLLLEAKGFTRVTRLYHPSDPVRAGLTDSATWETGYVSYDGHGSVAQVGDYLENFINSADAALLQNYVHPVFTALTCASGDYSYPGMRSVAGALVLNPNGGAIASFAPTGLSFDADAQLLGNAFVDNLFDGQSTIGEAVLSAKDSTSDDVSAFMLPIYSVVGEPAIFVREH
jgi:hypothetical protein